MIINLFAMYKKVLLVMLLLILGQGWKIKQKAVAGNGKFSYPIRAAYIDRTSSWYGDSIAKGLGVPGFAAKHDYNMIILAFWSCAGSPKDMAMIWANARTYFDYPNSFGNTTKDIQTKIRQIYHDNGINITVSAFGDSEFPTSAG